MATPNGRAARKNSGQVTPILPLFLLQAVRSHDRPEEVLEDEYLPSSLPRRLGLSGVVDTQIRRYEGAVRRREPIPVEEVSNLLRLILRRPDADEIVRLTGHEFARQHVERMPRLVVRVLRHLPRAALFLGIRRYARKLLRPIAGYSRPALSGRPLVARMPRAFTAELDPSGRACLLYASTLEELVFQLAGYRPRIEHTNCAARGDQVCEWTLAE